MPTRDEQAIADLEAQYGLGAGNRASDVANLAGKHEADRAAYMQALAQQYQGRAAPTGDRPFDSNGPMYDQSTNQLSGAGRSALQASPMTLGRLIGLAGGDPRFNPAMPQAQGMSGQLQGAPTLGQLALPASSHVQAPDWSYLTRGR